MTDQFDVASTQLILRRAFELAQRDPASSEFVIGRKTLAEIAAEVDLPASAVAAALAERKLGLGDEQSLIDRIVGPAEVATQRPSGVPEELTTQRTVKWLENGHGLRSRIRHDGVIVARPRSDFIGKINTALCTAQGGGGLSKTRQVSALAVDLEDDSPGAVCLVADISDRRLGAMAGGAAVTVGTGSLLGAAVVLSSPIWIVAAPVALGAGLLTARTVHQRTLRMTRHDVEEIADSVVRGEGPKSILGEVAKRIPKRR